VPEFEEFAPPSVLVKLARGQESKTSKARRLLTSGRVCVVSVDELLVKAFVEGDSGTYTVVCRWDRWECTCPAYGPVCSHIEAVRTVTRKRVSRAA